MKNPFKNGSGHLLVHCCHHKVGTSWFENVLRALGREFGLHFIYNDQSKLPDGPAIFLQDHSRVDFSLLGDYRGSHMIRDLRDVVISAYYYHLWTKEEWANTPIRDLPGNPESYWNLLPIKEIKHLSYKEYLNSLPREEGILAELRRASTTDLREMINWDYSKQNIFEFKYETIMANEEETFRNLFDHYGFTDESISRAWQIAAKFSFKNRAGRNVGEAVEKSHLRSGKLQQWKEEFSEKHKSYFKELHGKDLIKLGYETDMSW